ncbi:DUF748 domain-containing protein [Opitutus sp. ER46]|uniref:DUF748 domain-containing protein n=1 Tax=Opitutus sp. ER46 TaxID=2161864 RepID=UPI001304B0A3|nr:DUF748 domain-containing protein [Opitutus sp. ER46]
MKNPPARIIRRVRAWPRRVLVGIAVALAVLVAARVALPSVIRHQINARLAAIPGYRGQVEEIDLSLWRGAYALRGVSVFKRNGEQETPFFLARTIDFSVAWRELLHGKVVSDIVIERGELTFVQGPSPESSQKEVDRRWQEVVQDIFPFDIQHLEIDHGSIRYSDTTKTPHVDLFVTDMRATATGLRNRREDTKQEYPASIDLEGNSIGGGRLTLFAQVEPLAAKPHFHLSLKLSRVALPALNESLKAVANVEVGRGEFELVLEMGARDGAFEGYVKPFFNHLDFTSVEDKRKNLGERLWEKLVAGLAWLVKNKPRDQVATRVPFRGEFGDSQVGLWATVRNLFRHGFVQAFNPVVEGSVDPDKVKKRE